MLIHWSPARLAVGCVLAHVIILAEPRASRPLGARGGVEDALDGAVEEGGDAEGQGERGVVAAGLDGVDGLTRDAEGAGEVLLGPVALGAQQLEGVAHGASEPAPARQAPARDPATAHHGPDEEPVDVGQAGQLEQAVSKGDAGRSRRRRRRSIRGRCAARVRRCGGSMRSQSRRTKPRGIIGRTAIGVAPVGAGVGVDDPAADPDEAGVAAPDQQRANEAAAGG